MAKIKGMPSVPKSESVPPTEPKKKKESSALTLFILGNMLHEEVSQQLQQSGSSLALPSPHKAKLGAVPPPPFPPVPGSGMIDPSVPDDLWNISASGQLDKMKAALQTLKANPSDPAALEALMTYVINLFADPSKLDPKVREFLDSSLVGIGALLDSSMGEMISLAFFQGGANGKAAAAKFIADMKSYLAGMPQNPYAQGMVDALNQFNLDKFAEEHKGGVWIIAGNVFRWDDPDDQEIIKEHIFNLGPDGNAPNSYLDSLDLNGFSRVYRLLVISQILQIAGGDPDKIIILLCMWMVSSQDQHFEREEQGLGSTTNLLSHMTDKYATRLVNLAKSIGPKFSPKQAKEFADLYARATALMNSEGQLSSLSDGWNSGTVEAFAGIKIPTGIDLDTLCELTHAGIADPKELADALKSLLPTPPSGGEPTPSTSPDYQALLTGLEAGGGLLTGMSKTVSTQLSAIANISTALANFGHTIADSKGGGIAEMMLRFVNNQRAG